MSEFNFESPNNPSPFDKLVKKLRDGRIKLNVDWSYTRKYGCCHILCQEVFADRIREDAAACHVPITSMSTYK